MFPRLMLVLTLLIAAPALADPRQSFRAIEGGELSLADYRGGPVLVVNTASRCGYTHQYASLQALWDDYRDQGLTIVAVPSDDFRQELASNEAVKDFCEVQYGLTIPMTEITKVTGPAAHPFYAWLRQAEGFEPAWNFNKVLLDGEGAFVQAFGARDRPDGRQIVAAVEALLPGG